MRPKRILIIGGGISALSLAWFLKKQLGSAASIHIFQAQNRPGGVISSSRCGGFLFETGPHSWRCNSTAGAMSRLIEELSLGEEVIESSPEVKNRYIYLQRDLHRVPNSFGSLCTSKVSQLLFKGLWRDIRAANGSREEDESILEFTSRRFGNEIAHSIFDPILSGICAGDIGTLSMEAFFPSLRCMEREGRSIAKQGLLRAWKRGKNTPSATAGKIFSFKQGMSSLIARLAENLERELHLNSPVEKIHLDNDSVSLRLASGQEVEGDYLFSAVSPTGLASLLQESIPQVCDLLCQIPQASVAVVNLGYKKDVLPHQGFGYLIPRSEGEIALGAIWGSSAFPQQSHNPGESCLTFLLGGSHMKNFGDWSETEFLYEAIQVARRHLGIIEMPLVTSVKIIQDAIPQYTVGHMPRVHAIARQLHAASSRMYLLGNGFYGISVGDCIERAQEVSMQFAASVQ